uniref:Uncharacterized protein n=1 Tax=viral metagenome TaxID=1070528 RepID=A0A6M3XQ52_9ZZZZ
MPYLLLKNWQGYNDTDDPENIQPNQLAKNSQNVITTDGGQVKTRRGKTSLAGTVGASAVIGLYRAYMWGMAASQKLVWNPLTPVSNPRLVAVGDAEYKAYTGTAWTSLATVTANQIPSFCVYQSGGVDYLVMTNAEDAPLRWRGDLAVAAATFTSPVMKYQFCEEFQGFLFLLRGKTNGRQWQCSADGDMTNWPAYHLDDQAATDVITGSKKFAGALTIHTERMVYALRGWGIDTFNIDEMVVGSGAVAHNTIIETPFGLFYLGSEGPYLYRGGTQAQPVGGDIQGILADLSFDYRHRSCAALKEGRYIFLSMPIGSGQKENNKTLRLDLQRGVWDPPITDGYASLASADRGGDPNRLYGGETAGGVVLIIDEGTSDDGTAIDAIAEFIAMSQEVDVFHSHFRKMSVYGKANAAGTVITPRYRDEIDGTATDLDTMTFGTSNIKQSSQLPGAAQGMFCVPSLRCNILDREMLIRRIAVDYTPYGESR